MTPKTLLQPSADGRAPDREAPPGETARRGAGLRGLTIARVWGITIVVHPSWLVIFGLITWSLAVEYFPQEDRGFSGMKAWGAAVVTSLAFFASILMHELAHSRVALAYGIPIRRITLFVFGGVAELGREATSAGVELRIAVVGPVTSLALGLLFAFAAGVAQGIDLLSVPLLYLARINVILAVFNMVPGVPLDGGRAFRALVWWWTGSFERAARVASTMGRGIAAMFIIAGLVLILRGAVIDGVWLGLIGWFLQEAARTSTEQADIARLLSDAQVSQAMTRECAGVDGRSTLARLVQDEVLGAGRRCFVVTDDGHLAGLLTLHEIKTVPRERWPQVTAADVMVPAGRLATVAPHDALLAALRKLDDAGVAQMPVVDAGRFVGMLGREEILHYVRARAELGV